MMRLETVDGEPLHTIGRNYPSVDGSTSTKPLQDLIACRVYNLICRWEIPYRNAEREIQATVNGDLIISGKPSFPVLSLHSGTHDAYVKLINGDTDFILVARLPSANELAEADVKGVTLDVKPVALDAFVMLVHADNPVDSISLEQIRRIYSGKITNWLQISGINAPINAYQREENSGSQELLKFLVMGDTPTVAAPEMIVHTMMGPFNAIQGLDDSTFGKPGDPNGIGYSVYYYTWFIMGPLQDVKILVVEGIRPTSKTIADRTYPLISEVYVVIRADEPSDSTAFLLRDWLLTNDGQSVVQQSGYVPITPVR